MSEILFVLFSLSFFGFFLSFAKPSLFHVLGQRKSLLLLGFSSAITLASLISNYSVLHREVAGVETILPSPATTENKPDKGTFVKTLRAVDGDTIVLANGNIVRYIGIDTPETVDPRKPVQCFGKEAARKNRELVEGKEVKLVKDISETDKYGRLLRYVYLPDGTFINEYLVKEGYAYAVSFLPDIKYHNLFLEEQRKAKENGKGLWSACPNGRQ